ncbi:MAG: HD domain-containing protein [Gammaproteobacteria bacterium]|nr:MAG: HD domain-containing protein [Gammaproteobacteria bacterium]
MRKPATNHASTLRPETALPVSLLYLPRATVRGLLSLYDCPDPARPVRVIRGYDRPHALRTAKMCAALAHALGYSEELLRRYQAACLLHDLGRAGLDRRLFGRIWTWARIHGIPTRPAEWRAVHPDTPDGMETEAFLKTHAAGLRAEGVTLDRTAKAQIEMRLGYARRLRRRIRAVKPRLRQLGFVWEDWMEKVCLYYYYPEAMRLEADWVRELGEVLVACEQLEAYSNRRRGGDYYHRDREDLRAAFAYLEGLRVQGRLRLRVVATLRALTLKGTFNTLLAESRGQAIAKTEFMALRKLTTKKMR